LSEKLVRDILHDYSKKKRNSTKEIHNAEVILREDSTIDDFIDVVQGNRQYIKW
jgi:uncharacterized protein